MRIKSILLLLVCFLLFGFTLPAIACPPPDCDDCQDWNPDTESCEWRCSTGQCCDNDTCVSSCPACHDCVASTCVCAESCCQDSHCIGECKVCNNCSCEDDPSKCTGECHDGCSGGNCIDNPSLCTGECHNGCSGGSCVSDDSKCADCMTCIGGDCFDIQCAVLRADECERCNETTGLCESTCADCMICVAGDCVDIQCAVLGECERCNETTGLCESTCGSNQCCDHNICVDKCDPDDGATCTWTDPQVLDPTCTYLHETDWHCQNPGASCNWTVVEGPGGNATCAPCNPGCDLGSTFCVKLEPKQCRETFMVFIGMVCECKDAVGLITYSYAGTKDTCP